LAARLPNPNDDTVLEAAINGAADTLVTFNMRHFDRTSTEFGISIQSPAEVLKQLRRKP
jgi:predicted nucleic acid-binding protein